MSEKTIHSILNKLITQQITMPMAIHDIDLIFRDEYLPIQNELVDCIRNLMSLVDTPIHHKLNGEFADKVRENSREMLRKVNDPLCTTHKYLGPPLSSDEFNKAMAIGVNTEIIELCGVNWSPATRHRAIGVVRECLENQDETQGLCEKFIEAWNANPEIHF